MIVIIGLGNPDKKYEHTRHNMGYMAIDYFAKNHGIEFTKNKYHITDSIESIIEEWKELAKNEYLYLFF